MRKTKQPCIIILLPEYKDPQNTTTAKFLELETEPSDVSVGEWIAKLGQFIDFFSDEECVLAYNNNNLNACLFLLDTLPEQYPSRSQQLLEMLQDEYDIASRNKVFGDESKTGAVLESDRITNTSKYKIGDTKIQVKPLDIKQVFDWLCKNRHPQRVVLLNPKHGDENKGAHPDNDGEPVSQFTGSKETANELLQKAIGVPEWGRLFAYDDNKECYVDLMSNDKKVDLSKEERPYHIFPIDISTMMNIKNITRIRKKLALVGQGSYTPKK